MREGTILWVLKTSFGYNIYGNTFHCPQTDFSSKQNGSDAKAQQIEKGQLRKTAAIYNACHIEIVRGKFSSDSNFEILRSRVFIHVKHRKVPFNICHVNE